MEIRPKPSEKNDVKLLRFYAARHRQVVDSNVASLLQMFNTTYADVVIDTFGPYDVQLLRLALGTVCTLAWVIPRNLECHTALVCTTTLASLTSPISSISHFRCQLTL